MNPQQPPPTPPTDPSQLPSLGTIKIPRRQPTTTPPPSSSSSFLEPQQQPPTWNSSTTVPTSSTSSFHPPPPQQQHRRRRSEGVERSSSVVDPRGGQQKCPFNEEEEKKELNVSPRRPGSGGVGSSSSSSHESKRPQQQQQSEETLERRSQKHPKASSSSCSTEPLFAMESNYYQIRQSKIGTGLILYQMSVKKLNDTQFGVGGNVEESNPYLLNGLFRQVVKNKKEQGSLFPLLSGKVIIANKALIEKETSFTTTVKTRKKNRETQEFYEVEYQVTLHEINPSPHLTVLAQALSLLFQFAAQ